MTDEAPTPDRSADRERILHRAHLHAGAVERALDRLRAEGVAEPVPVLRWGVFLVAAKLFDELRAEVEAAVESTGDRERTGPSEAIALAATHLDIACDLWRDLLAHDVTALAEGWLDVREATSGIEMLDVIAAAMDSVIPTLRVERELGLPGLL